jgi:ribosomal protein S18 acetylase RimI-like enzyme
MQVRDYVFLLMESGTRDSLRLRAAVPEDEQFLRAVYASTRAEELARVLWSDEQKRAFTDMQFAAQDAHYRRYYPSAQYSIIEVQGVPAGRLYVDRSEKEILIIDIALLPEHRRAGIGTRLLRELQDEARTAGKVLTIHVEKFNPALRLYQRLGFQQVKDEGVYLLLEWKKVRSQK